MATARMNHSHLMFATSAKAPFAAPGWIFELKYDGFRCLVIKRGDRVKLESRPGRDMAASFPEVVGRSDRWQKVKTTAGVSVSDIVDQHEDIQTFHKRAARWAISMPPSSRHLVHRTHRSLGAHYDGTICGRPKLSVRFTTCRQFATTMRLST